MASTVAEPSGTLLVVAAAVGRRLAVAVEEVHRTLWAAAAGVRNPSEAAGAARSASEAAESAAILAGGGGGGCSRALRTLLSRACCSPRSLAGCFPKIVVGGGISSTVFEPNNMREGESVGVD